MGIRRSPDKNKKDNRRAGARRPVVVGLDGSPHASRVIGHLVRLCGRGRAVVVRVVEPGRVPSLPLASASVRAAVAGMVRTDVAGRIRTAQREVDAGVARLRRAGWSARGMVCTGVPLPELLRAVRRAKAGLLALGACGAGGAKRLFLGSVAHGAVNRAPVPVLIVR
jgi:nucleotide-binding universal stress UspA family protein